MGFLSIDYGAKCVGIALSDEKGLVAFPHETVENNEQLITYVRMIVKKENIEEVVVGDTRTESGGENTITEATETFVATLRKYIAVPVHCVPEQGTSGAARASLPEGAVRGLVQSSRARGNNEVNARAAALILQRFLDSRGKVES